MYKLLEKQFFVVFVSILNFELQSCQEAEEWTTRSIWVTVHGTPSKRVVFGRRSSPCWIACIHCMEHR